MYAHTHVPYSALTQRAPSILAAPQRPSEQPPLRRAQSRPVSKPPPATPTVIQTECACTRRPCPRPSASVHRTPSAPAERRSSVDRTSRSVPQWPSTQAHSAKRYIDQTASIHGLQQRCSHAAAATRSYTRCSSSRRRQAGALTNRARGQGQQGGALTPFLLEGLGASLRFSTMNPFLRPTARPVLSIVPGILLARGGHELKKSSYSTLRE